MLCILSSCHGLNDPICSGVKLQTFLFISVVFTSQTRTRKYFFSRFLTSQFPWQKARTDWPVTLTDWLILTNPVKATWLSWPDTRQTKFCGVISYLWVKRCCLVFFSSRSSHLILFSTSKIFVIDPVPQHFTPCCTCVQNLTVHRGCLYGPTGNREKKKDAGRRTNGQTKEESKYGCHLP